MFDILLLDLDDTILDFHKAERIAIGATLGQFGLEPTEEVLSRYHVINKWHWEQLELGKLTRAQVLENRFAVLFEEMGLAVDAAACARAYEKNLSIGHYFLPGAQEAVQRLSKRFRLFLVSNGTASVQHGRMTSAGLYPYFEKVFVSQEVGFNKPSPDYFRVCFSQIPDFQKERAIIVGDSLSSDIQGGINAGIATCWINPGHAAGKIRPDFELESLSQLENLLDRLNNA